MNVSSIQLCEDLMLLLGRWKNALTDFAEQRGLTQVQLAVLFFIDHKGELPMGKIASTLHCDASNVTGIVDRLVAHDLVVRAECPQDRRAKTLKLTSKGHAVVDSLKAALPDELGCDKLSERDRTDLHDIILKVCA